MPEVENQDIHDRDTDAGLAALVSALATEPGRQAALAELTRLGSATRTAVIDGLRDGRWEVRRWCVWLTRLLHPDDIERAIPLIRDPKSSVRHMAVVTLGAGDDPIAGAVPLLMERALDDPNIRVRRQAVLVLAFNHTDSQLEGFFGRLLETETDPKLHKAAGIGLFLCREQRREDEASSC